MQARANSDIEFVTAINIIHSFFLRRECSIEDSWCEGINLTTGRRGLFPNAYVTDVEYNEFGSGESPGLSPDMPHLFSWCLP